LSLTDLRKIALNSPEPTQKSGKQEWLENIINDYI
jgi:xylose isomerase